MHQNPIRDIQVCILLPAWGYYKKNQSSRVTKKGNNHNAQCRHASAGFDTGGFAIQFWHTKDIDSGDDTDSLLQVHIPIELTTVISLYRLFRCTPVHPFRFSKQGQRGIWVAYEISAGHSLKRLFSSFDVVFPSGALCSALATGPKGHISTTRWPIAQSFPCLGGSMLKLNNRSRHCAASYARRGCRCQAWTPLCCKVGETVMLMMVMLTTVNQTKRKILVTSHKHQEDHEQWQLSHPKCSRRKMPAIPAALRNRRP